MKYTQWLRDIKGYSENTINIYLRYIKELEIIGGKYEDLLDKYKDSVNSTKRLILSAIKSYYTYKEDERASKIELPKKNIVVKDYVSYEQYQGYLLNINKRTKMGLQKYIIVRLLFETGIRSSELLSMNKDDIDGSRIRIRGKGNKERYVMMSQWLTSDINEYLKYVDYKLFNFQYKNLHAKISRIDKNRRLTPHMFRRGFAKYCNKKGVSIYDISLSMGHSSIETTASYIKKSSDEVRTWEVF